MSKTDKKNSKDILKVYNDNKAVLLGGIQLFLAMLVVVASFSAEIKNITNPKKKKKKKK